MTITKYLHSCVLIEQDGHRILFDPGVYTFIEQRIRPEDIPAPDVIVLTHEHRDHVDPEALEVLTRAKGAELVVPVHYGGPEPADVQILRIDDTDEFQRGPFNVQGVDAPHGPILGPLPANVGVMVNDRVLNPGDSLNPNVQGCEVLLLPVAAPWLRIVEAVELAMRLKPQLVIPIHDGMLKEFFTENYYSKHLGPAFEQAGIRFAPLNLGQSITID